MTTLKVPVSPDDHIQGEQHASVTLVEYGDYQCPYCGMAYEIIKKVQKQFVHELRFVFRNFPLTELHPWAELAAESAEFAATHDKFWEMHDLLYENQQNLSADLMIELGKILKLPISELTEALEKRSFKGKIQKDFIGGVHSGVNGTPTFFINGYRYNDSYDLPILIATIDDILKSNRRKVA